MESKNWFMIHEPFKINLININLATDEGNSQSKIWHWTNYETGVAVQRWLWVQAELLAR